MREVIDELRRAALDRFGARRLAAAALVAALAVAAGGYALARTVFGGPGGYTVTAHFAETPGLYAHNSVQVLGVPSGRVESVTPKPGYVEVVLRLDRGVKVPASAQAVLMAPNPVSDRTVELTPPWTGGPVMKPGAVIPRNRTVAPLEIDQVFAAVDTLSRTLGPDGANAKGDLSAALRALAGLANGNGGDTREAIRSIAAALPALTADPDRLEHLLTQLAALTTRLAARNDTITALYGDLAGATSQLAAQRQTLSAALANLQQALTDAAGFVRANEKDLGATVQNLSRVVQSVTADQKALVQTFDTAPLGFQNANNALQPALCPDGPCTALYGRLSFTSDGAAIVKRYCGNSVALSLLPILANTVASGSGTPLDVLCAAETGVVQNNPGPPGAPRSPDLGLSTYLGPR